LNYKKTLLPVFKEHTNEHALSIADCVVRDPQPFVATISISPSGFTLTVSVSFSIMTPRLAFRLPDVRLRSFIPRSVFVHSTSRCSLLSYPPSSLESLIISPTASNPEIMVPWPSQQSPIYFQCSDPCSRPTSPTWNTPVPSFCLSAHGTPSAATDAADFSLIHQVNELC
jgi:hypothetical protein